jgi:hypothetical protein
MPGGNESTGGVPYAHFGDFIPGLLSVKLFKRRSIVLMNELHCGLAAS